MTDRTHAEILADFCEEIVMDPMSTPQEQLNVILALSGVRGDSAIPFTAWHTVSDIMDARAHNRKLVAQARRLVEIDPDDDHPTLQAHLRARWS